MMEIVQLNIRGTIFLTRRKTLITKPQSLLANLREDSENFIQERREYFFDRNPLIFHHILDYYTSGNLHIPKNICAASVREELNFWRIPQAAIAKCCWKSFYKVDEDMLVLDKIIEKKPQFLCNRVTDADDDQAWQEDSDPKSSGKLKHQMWSFLCGRKYSKVAVAWRFALVFVVGISILTHGLQTSREFRVDRQGFTPTSANKTNGGKISMFLETNPLPGLRYCDITCNTILSFDWFLRFISSTAKRKFLLNPMNFVELLTNISIWMFTIMEDYKDHLEYMMSFEVYIWIFTFLYTLRVLRMLHFTRKNREMRVLFLSVQSSMREICMLMISFACFTVIFAGFIYMAEIQKDTFSNMFIAVWWSVITMTTVGYGDTSPTTPFGYIVGGICAVFGIVLIAYPIAVTSSNFNDFYKFNKYRCRHQHALEKVKKREIENIFVRHKI